MAGIITLVQESGREILIVPGGGRIADEVRRLALPDDASHWMAILAMEYFGWYISSFGPVPVRTVRRPAGVEVLLPYRMMQDADPLPHSWNVTSDTISAWVACRLDAELILLKPVDGILRNGAPLPEVTGPARADEVDDAFIPFLLSHGMEALIVNGRIPDRVRACLAGEPTPGTRIHPSI
ncbi:MAG: uridylate kinase [Methanomicrobiaceae archaeon]|nr:uridylate kinase [Methanomicrobiaceae archaeon]